MKEGCGYRGRASQVRGRARTEALRQGMSAVFKEEQGGRGLSKGVREEGLGIEVRGKGV